MNAYEIEGLSYAYNGKAVLSDVGLSIASGRVTGVLGPNGAGKTTLAGLMTGALKPLSGTIRLFGERLEDIPHRRLARTVSLVPQRSRLDYEFTVREVALMGRYPHEGRMGGEKHSPAPIVEEALRQTGLTDLAERSVTRLSGGEYQRVLIARALCQRAPVMLMDEPVSNLDIGRQLEVLGLARKLAGEGLTVVCILHDLNLAARFCDDVALLCDGHLRAFGSPEDVLTDALMREVYGVGVKRLVGDGGEWALAFEG